MTDSLHITHLFAGGWATDFGPRASAGVSDAGIVQIPYLVDAENIVYEFDGGIRKMPGTSKLNSSALESGAAVMGIFDYWIHGSSGSPTQHRVIHVGTTIKKDDADGSFSNIFTGLESGKIPDYTILEDLLIICSDSTADVPFSWDGTTAQNLAGSPPNFSMCETHKNRVWSAGQPANPSRLNYSVLLDGADWTGSGSGTIDIDPNDGDHITAIVSYKNELLVFKGPYKGSIHRITGSAPTGTDAFARSAWIKGIGAVWHNSVFRFADDLGFMWSDGTIRSLKATASFGDYNEVALSRSINVGFIRDRINHGNLKQVWAASSDSEGGVAFTVPADGSSNNNFIIWMDFRFTPPRLALWNSFTAASLSSVVDSSDNSRRRIFAGGYDGFIRKTAKPDRSIDGSTAITAKVTLPFLDYGLPFRMKTLTGNALGFAPKNDGSVTIGWTRDGKTQQTATIDQQGGDVLGTASANQFTLGTSTLAGARFVDSFLEQEQGGEFRAIQYELSNGVNYEDVEIHSLLARYELGAESMEN